MGQGAGCADDTPSPEWSESCPEPAGRVPRPPLSSLQQEPPETFVLPLPPDTLATWLLAGTGQWRLCRGWAPALPSGILRPRCPQAQRAAMPPQPPHPVTAVLGAGKPRALAFTGVEGSVEVRLAQQIPARWVSPLPLPFSPFPDSSPCPLPPLQGVSCCPQSLTCAAIFMEEPVSGEMDLRSKKILHPHVSHKEHGSAPGADWNPQGCPGIF